MSIDEDLTVIGIGVQSHNHNNDMTRSMCRSHDCNIPDKDGSDPQLPILHGPDCAPALQEQARTHGAGMDGPGL